MIIEPDQNNEEQETPVHHHKWHLKATEGTKEEFDRMVEDVVENYVATKNRDIVTAMHYYECGPKDYKGFMSGFYSAVMMVFTDLMMGDLSVEIRG